MTSFISWLLTNLQNVEITDSEDQIEDGDIVIAILKVELQRLWSLYNDQLNRLRILKKSITQKPLTFLEYELLTEEFSKVSKRVDVLEELLSYEFGRLCKTNGSVAVRQGFTLVYTNISNGDTTSSAVRALTIGTN